MRRYMGVMLEPHPMKGQCVEFDEESGIWYVEGFPIDHAKIEGAYGEAPPPPPQMPRPISHEGYVSEERAMLRGLMADAGARIRNAVIGGAIMLLLAFLLLVGGVIWFSVTQRDAVRNGALDHPLTTIEESAPDTAGAPSK